MNLQRAEYKYLAGDHKDRGRLNTLPWGVNEMISKFRDDPTLGDPTLMPMGSSTERTGFHFDKILCDDLEAARSSATRDMIENIWDFYRLLHSILDPLGQMIIVCTRWHEDDIYRRIEKENEHLEGEEKFDIMIHPACEEDFTDLRFPNILDEKQLRSIKKKQGTPIFSCQYLLQPTPDSMRIFKGEYIKVWTPQMLTQARLHIYTTADFAFTEVRKSDFKRGETHYDYTVILTVAIDEQWNYIVIDWFREKCTPHTGIIELYRQWEQHKAKLSIVQKYDVRGVGESIDQVGYELGKQMPIDYVAYPPDSGKVGRIKELVQPRFEDKKVYLHPTMVTWFANEEMLDFPKAKYDDGLDALCNIIRFGKPPPRVRVMNQLTKEQKEIELLKAGVDPTEQEDDWMYV
jgi:predicted phage terminase large subunit-like protein